MTTVHTLKSGATTLSAMLPLLMILCSLAGVMSCAGTTSRRSNEPGILVVSNKSGQDIETVKLTAAAMKNSGPVRHGSISPVPLGASQIFVRPTSAPSLPDRLRVQWTTAGGQTYRRTVSLIDALRSRTVSVKTALVFDILPGQRINVFLEEMPD